MNRKLNIRHQIIIALGTYDKCKNIIDEIYAEDEQKYYESYLKSELYHDILKEIFILKDLESINKLIGIFEVAYKEDRFFLIQKIIGQVNPSIIRYVKTKHTINIPEFLKKYYDYDSMTEHEVFVVITSLLYYSFRSEKNISSDSAASILTMYKYWGLLTDSASNNINNHKQIDTSNLSQEKFNEYYDMLLLDNEKQFPILTDYILSNIIETETAKIANDKKMNIKNFDEYMKCRDLSFSQGISKYIGVMSGIIGQLGLDTNSIFRKNINKNELDYLFMVCENFRNGNKLNEEETKFFTIISLYLYTLIDLYNDAKHLYLNKSSEDKYQYLINLERNLQEEQKRIKDVELKYNKEINEKDKEIAALKNSIKLLTSDINQLENHYLKELEKTKFFVEKDEEKNMQIKIYQNILNSIEFNNDNGKTTDEMIDYLNDYKIALFGGHNQTRTKLQQNLRNINIYSSISEDLTSLKYVDIVYINTDWFSHSFVEKVLTYCTKYSKNFIYIGGTNFNIVIKQMYEALYKINTRH